MRTLDRPFKGITGGSFASVRNRLVFPLPKPDSYGTCRSLLIAVCGGLAY